MATEESWFPGPFTNVCVSHGQAHVLVSVSICMYIALAVRSYDTSDSSPTSRAYFSLLLSLFVTSFSSIAKPASHFCSILRYLSDASIGRKQFQKDLPVSL